MGPLDVAAGAPFGLDADAPPLPSPRRGDTPRAALERAVLPALRRPPCLVSFSGGRDSSTVLALAAAVARREGLPLPVPATNRFPNAPLSHESEWQERVVAHLALEDWLRLEWEDELDVVGPIAARVLERHGLLFPFNGHFHVPLLEAARGGSLLTGVGGDEAFSPSQWALAYALLRRSRPPRRSDLRRLGYLAAPAPLRAWALRRARPLSLPWIKPAALAALERVWARTQASEPLRRRSQMAWWWRHRYLQMNLAGKRLLADDHDVTLVHPFADPGFLAVVAPVSEIGLARSSAMTALFGDLLPSDVLERTTKGRFDEAFWGRHSRALVRDWSGDLVDPAVVDADALREVWGERLPPANSFSLLQSVWLAARAATSEADSNLSTGLVD